MVAQRSGLWQHARSQLIGFRRRFVAPFNGFFLVAKLVERVGDFGVSDQQHRRVVRVLSAVESLAHFGDLRAEGWIVQQSPALLASATEEDAAELVPLTQVFVALGLQYELDRIFLIGG